MLPVTGPDSLESAEVLDWALEELNKKGGINGTTVKLEYKDTYNRDLASIAREFIEDPAIQIVIGPQKSNEVYDLAPLFINNHKLLISPMATAGDIARAWGGKGFIWRTCQSDVAQVRSILYELATRNVKSIALLYLENGYGKTFLEWAGFFCTELGIDLLNAVGYTETSDLADKLDKALIGNPEFVLTVAYSNEAVKFKKLLDEKPVQTKLFFTDAAETPYLIEQLGAASEGVELISPAADPDSGFENIYKARFGYYPWDYAAPTYDAFLLSVYTLARQESQKGLLSIFRREAIEESLKKVISGTGIKLKWNESDQAINLILHGELPDVDGASSPLTFDKQSGVDPTESFYSLNRIETRNGVTDFWTIKRFSSSESAGVGLLDKDSSAVLTRASANSLGYRREKATFQPDKRKDLWAVIVSTSDGWDNYRHQSDALAIYNLLKQNRVSDDNIILFSIDDVPWINENPLTGDIHHEINGPNVREKAIIDYYGGKVNLDNFRNVLLGIRSEQTPDVLDCDEHSNVLVYLVGHGGPQGLHFENGDQLTPNGLAQLIDAMYLSKKYRQMLMIAESCYGENLALGIDTPGFIYLTGASRIESSFGATYDQEIGQWLADDFTAEVLKAIRKPGITLEQLYLSTYSSVAGSHVRLVNYSEFGDLDISVDDFIKP